MKEKPEIPNSQFQIESVEFEEWVDEFERRQKNNLRKIVAFELDNELYGVDIEEVSEVIRMVAIRPVPNVETFILGLINLRGKIVPVIDLGIRFQLNQKPTHLDNRIIIVKKEDLLVGVVVDRMEELLRLPADAFQPPPPDVARIDPEYLKEVIEINDRMLIVLDMRKILNETARR